MSGIRSEPENIPLFQSRKQDYFNWKSAVWNPDGAVILEPIFVNLKNCLISALVIATDYQ